MQIGKEIIEVLEYLCDKVGLTIDWTSDNVLPFLQQLCEKYVKWEMSTSIAWIAIWIFIVIILAIIKKSVDWCGFEKFIFWVCVFIATLVIGTQVFDIIECSVIPEKVIWDFVESKLQNNY